MNKILYSTTPEPLSGMGKLKWKTCLVQVLKFFFFHSRFIFFSQLFAFPFLFNLIFVYLFSFINIEHYCTRTVQKNVTRKPRTNSRWFIFRLELCPSSKGGKVQVKVVNGARTVVGGKRRAFIGFRFNDFPPNQKAFHSISIFCQFFSRFFLPSTSFD